MHEVDLRDRRQAAAARTPGLPVLHPLPGSPVLQGSPLLGVAFALQDPTGNKAVAALVFAAASFMLVAHIWSFNDWAGLTTDLNDPNKSDRVFSTKGVSSRGLLLLSR